MSYLIEHPLPIALSGIIAFAIALVGWTQSRHRGCLVAALSFAVLTVASILLERITVTRAEEIEATLQQIAEDLEANDLRAIRGHISSKAPELRNDAESILQQVEIRTVSIKRNLKVSVSENEGQAKATFNAVASLKDRAGQWDHEIVPRFFEVDFVLEDGRWRVVRYLDYDPRRGMQRADRVKTHDE
jgi:hypothetical protein